MRAIHRLGLIVVLLVASRAEAREIRGPLSRALQGVRTVAGGLDRQGRAAAPFKQAISRMTFVKAEGGKIEEAQGPEGQATRATSSNQREVVTLVKRNGQGLLGRLFGVRRLSLDQDKQGTKRDEQGEAGPQIVQNKHVTLKSVRLAPGFRLSWMKRETREQEGQMGWLRDETTTAHSFGLKLGELTAWAPLPPVTRDNHPPSLRRASQD